MFNLHQSQNLDSLAKNYAQILSSSKRDPFVKEQIVTQTAGINQWLSLKIAKYNGIFASAEFSQPVEFLTRLYFILEGKSEKRTIYEQQSMSWAIYDILSSELELFPIIKEYLKDSDEESSKLLAFSERVADLFDGYMMYRPEMLASWLEDKFAKNVDGTDLFSGRNRRSEEWQKLLWQKISLRGKNAESPAHFLSHLHEILQKPDSVTVKKLTRWADRVERITLFGMSILPPQYLEIYGLLANYLDLHVFVLNPSIFYWGDSLTDRQVAYRLKVLSWQGKDGANSILGVGNKLLRNLGESGGDFFGLLYDRVPNLHEIDYEESEESEPTTLLENIQADISLWRDNDRKEPLEVDSDSSITINSCHSPLREIEVLYDYLLSCFEGSNSLTPSDILIITPDIENYAPLVTQIFSKDRYSKSSSVTPNLNVSFADRSLFTGSSLTTLVRDILVGLESRFEASLIFSIFEQFCIHTDSELSVDDRSIIKKWINESGVRWGLDKQFWSDKSDFHFENLPFSWESGRDRVMAGFSMGNETIEGVPSYAEFEGSSSHLMGRLFKFVESLASLFWNSRKSKTAQQWSTMLISSFRFLFDLDESGDDDPEELVEIIRTIKKIELETEIAITGSEDIELDEQSLKLPFSHFKTVLLSRLDELGKDSPFMRGDITVASMIPMRTIPFKVICVVGLNHDAFPRSGDRLAFDLMQAKKRKGDRDIRKGDLYLFLEFLVATKEKLYISYCGRDIKSNESRPPATVVSQLTNFITENFRDSSGEILKQAVPIQQPLQPFSKEYLKKSDSIFSYNSSWFNKIVASKNEENMFDWSLSSVDNVDENELSFDSLFYHFSNPLKQFLRDCRIRFATDSDNLEDEEPIETDGLKDYLLLNAKVLEELNGNSDELSKLIYSGNLPLGAPLESAILATNKKSDSIISRIKEESDISKLSTILIEKRVDGVDYYCKKDFIYRSDNRLLIFDVGKLNWKRRLSHWLFHLFVNLDEEVETVLLTLDTRVRYKPIGESVAIKELKKLAQIKELSKERLIPFFGDISDNWISGKKFSIDSELSNLLQTAAEGGFLSSRDKYYEFLVEHTPCGFLESDSFLKEARDLTEKIVFPMRDAEVMR
jgi:exodeoxyribonuclease V gamma subunit